MNESAESNERSIQTPRHHAPRFTLLALFGIVAAASACLALTNAHFLVAIPFLLVFVIAIAVAPIHDALKRGLIWGAVLGAVSFALTIEVVADVTGGHLSYGAVMDFSRRYTIPVGGFSGGTIGYLFATR